jgi:hypothetical protein
LPYGIPIRSQRPLPFWLASESGSPDDELLIDVATAEATPPSTGHSIERSQAALRFNDGTTAQITRGSRVMLFVPEDVEPSLVDITIAGPILGVVMFQRGDLVLHASAVRRSGRAAALLGDSGAGKSTVGAMLHIAGWALVADDLVPVRLAGAHLMTRAGYPLMKLSPQSAELIGADANALIPLDAGSGKRGFLALDGFEEGALSLTALYVLAPGPLAVETLSPPEAVTELVRATYVSHLLRSPEGRRGHFELATEIVRQIPVRRLYRGLPDEIGRLPALLEEDLASLG